MKKAPTLYFDHQATTPVSDYVFQKMSPFFRETFGNPHSVDHVIGWESSKALETSTADIARLINADPDEIIYTSGATEANNLAILGLGFQNGGGQRKRILVSAIEHKSVLASASVLRDRFGFQVETVPVNSEGLVSVNTLQELLDEKVLVVSVMAVNNEIGTIQDVQGLSVATRNVGAIFHTDAAQSPLAMRIGDMAIDADLVSLSGHKMNGPPGIGVLYARRDIQSSLFPLIHGGGQQNGLRSGTVPLPLCVGMGAAAEWLCREDSDSVRTNLRLKKNRFVEKLLKLPWHITVNGPIEGRRHPGNTNICFHGFSAHDILDTLQPTLAASTGSACTSGMPTPSHVLRAIGLTGEEAESSIRFSLGAETSEDDINRAIEFLARALEKLSETSSAVPIKS